MVRNRNGQVFQHRRIPYSACMDGGVLSVLAAVIASLSGFSMPFSRIQDWNAARSCQSRRDFLSFFACALLYVLLRGICSGIDPAQTPVGISAIV